jgi:hypothetical protein
LLPRERLGRRDVEPHARQPVQPDQLDQRHDLGLGAAQQNRTAPAPEPPREHRQVEHQRRVGEHQLAEVDDDVTLGPESPGQGPAPEPLCRPILVAATAQSRRLVLEVDDSDNL